MNKIVLEKIKNLLLNTFTNAEVEGSISELKIGRYRRMGLAREFKSLTSN